MVSRVFLLWIMENGHKRPDLKRLTIPSRIAQNTPCGCSAHPTQLVSMGRNPNSRRKVLVNDGYIVERRNDGLYHVDCGKKVDQGVGTLFNGWYMYSPKWCPYCKETTDQTIPMEAGDARCLACLRSYKYYGVKNDYYWRMLQVKCKVCNDALIEQNNSETVGYCHWCNSRNQYRCFNCGSDKLVETDVYKRIFRCEDCKHEMTKLSRITC